MYPADKGSSPLRCSRVWSGVAQLAEHDIRNVEVVGSMPIAGPRSYGAVEEMESSAPCHGADRGFEARPRRQAKFVQW